MRKKKSTKETISKEKKSRAKFQCPEKLKHLIRTVNEIERDVVLPDWEQISAQMEEEYLAEEDNSRFDSGFSYEIKQMTFDSIFPKLPDKLKMMLESDVSTYFDSFYNRLIETEGKNAADKSKAALDFDRQEWLIHCYRTYENLRADLLQIVRYMARRRSLGREPNYMDIRLPILRDQTKVGEDDMWEEKPLGIKSYTKGISLDRIRACEICDRIFWANNKNSFACSKPCSNTLQQRKHRENNKEIINEKRRGNYQIKKHLQKNKNGNL